MATRVRPASTSASSHEGWYPRSVGGTHLPLICSSWRNLPDRPRRRDPLARSRCGIVGSKGTGKVAMAGTKFTIGVDVSCSDGICGEVLRVVVDPVARRVTHLVVEPKHRQGLGRLVPLDLVDATSEHLLLRCTLAEFEQLDDAEETDFMLDMGGNEGYAAGQVLS